ncbi:hypothetical protein WN51_00539, partial [Melipona quadrifasciata]
VVNNDIHEIFMTPDDFLRSITPGIKQPDGNFNKIKLLYMYKYHYLHGTFSTQ